MNDKMRLLEYAVNKIASEEEFMAFILTKYIEIESTDEQSIIDLLKFTKEEFYKLCLCKSPDINAPNYVEKVKELSQYTNAEIFELNNIIKRVNAISDLSKSETSRLMAARDKQKKEDND